MIIPDKKKTASIIVSKMGGDKMHAEKPTSEDMSGDDPGLQAAAEDILQAIADKSALDLKESLKAFFQMVDKDEMPEED